MRETATVAAVIATMNRPGYVREAIESACEQTYGHIEIVVVDGSDDQRTATVVSELRSTYPERRIVYRHNDEPKGLPAARNQAIAETDAAYIAFLDDDDRWHPQKTKKQLSRFESSDGSVGLVYTGAYHIDERGTRLRTIRPCSDELTILELSVENVIGTPSSVMVTREAFDWVGGFDESMRYCEDWDFYLRVASAYDIACIAEPLIDRRYHDESMIADLDSLFRYRKQLLAKHADTLDAHGTTARAWNKHRRDAAETHLNAGNRAQARELYYTLFVTDGDRRAGIAYLILSLFSADRARSAIHALSAIERQFKNEGTA
ncbi:glycosyltransferase family 2 protein [Halalkalirubrum salinum]|uniref:glycosyltransferase family 2 protein n=1 Tax=Halalkalirubrum salinum TaxID=2563889 RepID=UPI0010FB8C22|nr:glycosyltransferase family A protein [Halalkalirubrum salinum]